MIDDNGAALEVGFQIDFGDAFGNLRSLDDILGEAAAHAVREFQKMEQASKGAIDLSGATTQIRSFAGTASRELRLVALETARIEAAGEKLVGQLERQNSTFGKTRDELLGMKVETAALAAEQKGMAELAGRLRTEYTILVGQQEEAARAAALEAQAVREAAQAYNLFERAAREGMAAARAIEENAAAAERMRMSTDPLYAAQKRINDEIAESTRLYKAGVTAEAEYARQQDVLTGKLNGLTASHDTMVTSTRKGSGALTQLSFQLNDVATMAASGSPPFQILATQAGQIVQVFQMAEGGARGLAAEIGGLLLRFSPFIVAAGAAAAGLGLFVRWVNQGVTNNQLTKDLGDITGGADATKQELYKLKDAEVEWGDVTKALFSVIGKDIASSFVGDMKGMSNDVKTLLDDLTSYGRKALAAMYAGVAGTKAYLGELEKGGLLGIGKMMIGQGDPKLIEKTYGAAYDAADKYLGKLGARVKTAAIQNARERLAKSIGYNNEPKPKTDKHAEQLAREAAATEAQIRNLYALADAYGVSGAAALIAEARVKAESDAIKKRADIEARVAQQVRLAVAQRVCHAAETRAGVRGSAGEDVGRKVGGRCRGRAAGSRAAAARAARRHRGAARARAGEAGCQQPGAAGADLRDPGRAGSRQGGRRAAQGLVVGRRHDHGRGAAHPWAHCNRAGRVREPAGAVQRRGRGRARW